MTAAVILVYLTLRGVCEGMIMTRYTDPMASVTAADDLDGVRCHRWFGWYHLLTVMRDGALLGVAAAVWKWGPGPAEVLGALVMGWELFELGYSWTRYRRWIGGHENFLGCVSVDGKWAVLAIHAARVLTGVALMVGGVLCGK